MQNCELKFQRKASLLDYTYPGLNPLIWLQDGTLNPVHKDFVLKLLNSFYQSYNLKNPELWVTDISVIGSLTTNKYLLNKSDFDCHVIVDIDKFIATNMPNASKEEAIIYLDNARKEWDRAKILMPFTIGVTLELYFESSLNPSNVEHVGRYSILQSKWLKDPIYFAQDLDFEISRKEAIEGAKVLANELDDSFGEIGRQIQRIDELKEVLQAWPEDKRQLYYAKVQNKLDIIEEQLEKSIQIKQDLVDIRHKKQDAFSENEIQFKFLARFHYFSILQNLKTLLEQTGGEISTTELPLIEKIISQGSIEKQAELRGWLSPEGKFFKVDNHADWALEHAEELGLDVKESLDKDPETDEPYEDQDWQNIAVGLQNELISKDWSRIGDVYGGKGYGIEISDLYNVPSALFDFLLQNPLGNNVILENPDDQWVRILQEDIIYGQKAVNKALQRKRMGSLNKQAGQVIDVNGVRVFKNPSIDLATKIFHNSKDLNVRYVIDPDTNDMYIWDAYNLHHMPAMEALGLEWTQEIYDNFTGTISSDDDIESLFTFHAEGGGERQKAASQKQAARLDYQSWLVDPNGKVYKAGLNHAYWVFGHKDLLEKEYGIHGDFPQSFSGDVAPQLHGIMKGMQETGWTFVGLFEDGIGCNVGNIKSVPDGVFAFLQTLPLTTEEVMFEDLSGNSAMLSFDEVPFGQKAINEVLQQQRMGSIKEAFLKEAFEEPKEVDNVLLVDFDGTIAKEKKFPASGEPEPGVKEALEKLQELGYTVVIYSARCNAEEGRKEVTEFLKKHDIPYDKIYEGQKPLAFRYIDDRAISFNGNWPDVVQQVEKAEKRASLSIVSDKIYTREELERMGIDDLDRMAYGHASGEIIQLNPSQIKIQYPVDLSNPEYKFEQKGMDWIKSVDFSEPIKVSIKQNGKFYLEDGHHRWFAAKKLGLPLMAEIEVKAKPIETILQRQEKLLSKHASLDERYWISPNGEQFPLKKGEEHFDFIRKQSPNITYTQTENLFDQMIAEGWTRVGMGNKYFQFVLEVKDLKNPPAYLDDFIAQHFSANESKGIAVSDRPANYVTITDPFPTLQQAVQRQLRRKRVYAHLSTKYWLDPQGKEYDLKELDHGSWIEQNRKLLEGYGFTFPNEYWEKSQGWFQIADTMLQNAWTRITTESDYDFAIEVADINNLPSYLDNFVARHYTGGGIAVDDLSGDYQDLADPFPSLKKQINKAKALRRQPVMAKAFSKKEIKAHSYDVLGDPSLRQGPAHAVFNFVQKGLPELNIPDQDMFDILGDHPRYGSTVSRNTLKDLNIPISEDKVAKQAQTKKVKQGEYSCIYALVPHKLAQEIVEFGVRLIPDDALYVDEDK